MIIMIILGIVVWIGMTFLSMFLMTTIDESMNCSMFDFTFIILSFIAWYIIIPICGIIWLIRLIAYPFRKTWW